MSTTAKAPLVYEVIEAPPLAVAEAAAEEALLAAEAVPVPLEVADAEEDWVAAVAAMASAVAFRVPQTRLERQVAWAWASPAFLSLHCANVSSQIKKGMVWEKAEESGTVPLGQTQVYWRVVCEEVSMLSNGYHVHRSCLPSRRSSEKRHHHTFVDNCSVVLSTS